MGSERAGGGQWWIDVDDGTYKMGKGKIDNPNVTFVAKDKDWVAVSNHQTRRHLGLFNRPAKNSRRPGTGEKARRNFPLEFRFCGDPDVRSWIGSLRLVRTEKIEISFGRGTSAGNDLERFETGITTCTPARSSLYWRTALCSCSFCSVARQHRPCESP